MAKHKKPTTEVVATRIPLPIQSLLLDVAREKGTNLSGAVRMCIEFALRPEISRAYVQKAETISPRDLEAIEQIQGQYLLYLIKSQEMAEELIKKIHILNDSEKKMKGALEKMAQDTVSRTKNIEIPSAEIDANIKVH